MLDSPNVLEMNRSGVLVTIDGLNLKGEMWSGLVKVTPEHSQLAPKEYAAALAREVAALEAAGYSDPNVRIFDREPAIVATNLIGQLASMGLHFHDAYRVRRQAKFVFVTPGDMVNFPRGCDFDQCWPLAEEVVSRPQYGGVTAWANVKLKKDADGNPTGGVKRLDAIHFLNPRGTQRSSREIVVLNGSYELISPLP